MHACLRSGTGGRRVAQNLQQGWCGHAGGSPLALCSRRGTGMASRFLEGRAGYLPPRLALAFSHGGSIMMQSKPPAGAPAGAGRASAHMQPSASAAGGASGLPYLQRAAAAA